MTGNRIISFILCCILLLGCLISPICAVTAEEDLSVSNGFHGIDSTKAYLGQGQLVENVKSAFLFEVNSQSLLYSWNSDLPQYPASLVKIMTALLVLENAGLSEVVTVKQSALDTLSSDAISVDLVAGEQITVEDLLYCLIVKSANDAAAVLAEHISSSQSAFVEKMNVRAAELGCTGTTYINPHGLHHEKQVTTARDTCRILMEALKHPFFSTVFGTVHYTVPATNMSDDRLLQTNNYLMCKDDVAIYLDTRVTGGRTGVTAEGYRCIASTAQSGNMNVICIVMGCASTFLEDGYRVDVFGGFPETTKLLDLAFDGNAMRQIVFKNQILFQNPVLNGDSDVFATANEDIFAVIPEDYTLNDLSFQYLEQTQTAEAPIAKGQSLGTVQIMFGSTCIAQTELFAANDVAVAVSKSGTYLETGKKGFPWGLLIIFIVLSAAGFFVIKRMQTKNRRTKGSRRRY